MIYLIYEGNIKTWPALLLGRIEASVLGIRFRCHRRPVTYELFTELQFFLSGIGRGAHGGLSVMYQNNLGDLGTLQPCVAPFCCFASASASLPVQDFCEDKENVALQI